MRRVLQLAAVATLLLVPAWAQEKPHKIGELELQILGIQAGVEPANPTVPKNIASGVRVVVTAGGRVLDGAEVAAFVGSLAFFAEAELSGPGLRETITIPQRGPEDPLPEDPLLLALPPLSVAGDYTISNLRLVVGSRSVLDVHPQRIPLKVIDQVLVTSVKTRPLTLDEIREKGIVLDSDDYLGFDFSLGLKLESTVVNVSLPVVFDRNGAVVPQPPETPEIGVNRGAAKAPPTVPDAVSILPVMLTAIPESESAGGSRAPLTFWEGQPIRIPSVLVIPGNVGYLKQFFSAQLFVANGAPLGAPLTVRDVTGTIKLPLGDDHERGGDNNPASDDPLVLATTVTGPQPDTLPVRGVGPDGEAGSPDDAESLAPGEQGQAEFLLRGDKEGFHTIDLDIKATLEGLPVGPVKIGGKATGGVLVRNPSFDVSFSVPSTVRRKEKFKVFMTVTNVGQGVANGLTVTLDQLALAGATLLSGHEVNVPTIAPGQAKVVTFEFRSDTTGAVVASYLGFSGDAAESGSLSFKLGVGERGVPLSPDTLALPASVEQLPPQVVDAAMRVLGQAWSLAGAPPGSLPAGVTRASRAVVQQRAMALAEAGLRVGLGELPHAAVGDLIADFFSPRELDPGFDQLLRQTEAGRDLARVLGAALAQTGGSALPATAAELALASVLASGPDFVSFAASVGPDGSLSVSDGLGRRLAADRSAEAIGTSAIPGGALLPFGPADQAPFIGLLSQPSASPYTVELGNAAELSLTLPRGDGSFGRAQVTSPYRARVVVDLARPEQLNVEEDQDGDGSFEASRQVAVSQLDVAGPTLLSASLIGPESFAAASQFGTNFALLFDRPVDPAAAAHSSNYQIPDNRVLAAKRQLTGRLVFGSLEFPEGPHVPTTLGISGIADERGQPGTPATLPLVSRFDPEDSAGGVVIGRVLSSDGTPVNGGTVYYSNASDVQCDADLGAASTTVAAIPLDDQAAYQIRYVSRNRCELPFEIAYQAPDGGALRKVAGLVRYDGEQIVMDVALIGRGSVTGTVRDLAGQPAPGAAVAVVSETDALTSKQVVADGDGRYVASDVAVGVVTVKAGKGLGLGFGAGRIERSGTTATVDVTLDTGAAARVTGRVYRIDGDETFPVVAELLGYSVGGATTGYTYTDLDGRFAFENMPAGSFRIAGRSGFANGVPGQTEVNIVVETRPPTEYGTVRGTVVLPDGTPAKRVIVARDVSSFIIDGGVALDALSRFEMTGLPLGQDGTLHAITADRKRTGSASFHIDPVTRVAEGVVIRLSGVATAEFTVKDANDVPVPNVEVTLVNPGGPLTRGACANPCGCQARLTGPGGNVSYEDMPLGRVSALAIRRGAGFIDVAQGTASLTEDGQPGIGVLRFAGTGIVSGVVHYPQGTAGGGGEVTLSSRVFRNDGRSVCGLVGDVSHRAQIDPQTGQFRFTGVNVGPVFVTATNGFFPTPVGASGTLTRNGEELPLELRFVSTIAGELSGTVLMPDGLTPAGAGVEVTADGASLQNVTVRTNAEGKYRFAEVLPAGGYTLTARDAATGSVARGSVYLAVARDAELNLRLKSRGIVRVRVVDGADQPVDKAFVKLAETEFPNKTYEAVIEPASQGVATFDRVFEGPFSVEAKGATTGGRAASVLPRVAGSSVEVKVRLAVTGTVKGQFRYPDGNAVPFGLVTLKSAGRTLGQVTTPGSGPSLGEFLFEFVPAGSFRLEAQDPLTTRSGFAVGNVVGQDQVVTVNVAAQGLGKVQGVVTSNGQPWTTGAAVVVASGSFRATTFADGAGHYVIEGVPEGRVDVTASPSFGFLTGTASSTLTGDGTVLTLDVALRDSGTLKGRVVRADGTTQGPPSIVSISAGGSGGGNQSVATDALGRFQFDRVPSGRVTLSVDAIGSIDLARLVVEVPAGETVNLDVPLNGLGAIHGQALGSDGQPIAGQVSLSGTGAFPWSQTIAVSESGEFDVHEALAGAFTVSLRATVGTFTLFGTGSGTLAPGETEEVVVQVQDSGTVKGHVVRSVGNAPVRGAEVTLELDAGRGSVVRYTDDDGNFEALGVPIGLFALRVFEPVTTGRVVVTGKAVRHNGDLVDLLTLVLDESAPALQFLEPQGGITRGRFAGPVVLELGNAADVDPASLRLIYPNGAALADLVISGNLATGLLSVAHLKVGKNVLRARARDRTGNEAEAEVGFNLNGGTIQGSVTRPDGSPAAGVEVVIQGFEPIVTGADGSFSKTGIAPGGRGVTATDPATGFQQTVTAILADGENEVATADIGLPAYGQIAGTVRHANGQPAFGVRVLLGGDQRYTDSSGRFVFDKVILGSHSLLATDETNGDRGSTQVQLVSHGQQAPATIALNGVGSAEVHVNTASGLDSSAAAVDLTSSAGWSDRQFTGPDGKAHFTNVLAGQLRAVATDTRGITGENTGPLLPGGHANIEVTLQAAARVQGQVTHHDDSAAPGVTVELLGSKGDSTTSDGTGHFEFQNVPGGHFELIAREAATKDRGEASGDVVGDGQPVTVSIQLIGTGSVHATVLDGNSAPVTDAKVDVSWEGPFRDTRTAYTGGTGVAIVTQVLAGEVTVNARAGPLGAPPVTDVLPAGGSVSVTLTLEGTGTVRGRVLEPDGTTPASGVKVGIGLGGPGEYTTTDGDGVYAFPGFRLNVPLSLFAYRNDRLRATGSITLTEHGQVAGPDLVMVGAGTVTGLLRDSAGVSVPVHDVSLSSHAAYFGGLRPAKTDFDGRYTISDVPVGRFSVSAVRGPDRADAEGEIQADGEVVPLNLSLKASAVTVPYGLADGNAWGLSFQADGRFVTGDACVNFAGGHRLKLVKDGFEASFAGSGNTVTTEENKRELVFGQAGLHGLSVTRKAFVPREGYFLRYLDLVRNDGSEPVTVDVVFLTETDFRWNPALVASSSGDATLEAGDRWAAYDDVDGSTCAFPHTALGFAGAGGLAPSSATFTKQASVARLETRWGAVTLVPGQTKGFLHVQTRQPDLPRAQASADRLVALPPELLVGLTTEEAQAVVNFVVPADLVSAIAPLPALDGEVVGRLFSGDSVTPVAGTAVRFESRSPHYHRPITLFSGGDGGFRFVADLGLTAQYPTLVPREAFDLSSSATGVAVPLTAEAQGAFPSGARQVTQELVFSGVGAVEGRVLRSDGSAVSNAFVRIDGPSGGQFVAATTGSFRFPLVSPGAPGTYTLTATHPLGGVTAVANDLVVNANQKTARDLVFAPLGSLTGTVRTAGGVPVTSLMSLTAPGGFSRGATATGTYTFVEVPPGTYGVTANDARNFASVTRQVEITAGPPTALDLTLAPVGTVQVIATVSGAALKDGVARWQSDARGPGFFGTCFTDSLGLCTLTSVPGPSVRVRVEYPGAPDSYAETTVPLTAEGESVPAAVSVPGVGTVTGFIRARNGAVLPSPSAGAVALYHATQPTLLRSWTATDAAGRFTFTKVPVGPFRIRVWRDAFKSKGEAAGVLAAHGGTIELDVVEPRGVLASPGQWDAWQLSFAAGAAGHVVVEGFSVGGSALLADPTVEVYGPDGALVARQDDTSPSNSAAASFTASLAGKHVVVVRTKAAAGGGYRLGSAFQNEAHVFRVYDGATVGGRVTREGDGAPVENQRLRLTLPGGTAFEARTATDGSYAVPVLASGDATLEALDDEGVTAATATAAIPEPVASATLDLVVPARGTVDVTVRRAGLGAPNAAVVLTSDHATALEADKTRTRTTSSSGTASASLPVGNVTASTFDELRGVSVSATGVLTAASSLELTLTVAGYTTFRGTVRATDGTPLIGATVTLSTGQSTTTSPSGQYVLGGVVPGEHTLTASYQRESLSEPVSAPFDGSDQTVDFTLAVDVQAGGIPTLGLKTWLRADAGVTTEGDQVLRWDDQSENANHATPPSVAARPRWLQDPASGAAVLRFDGATDYVNFTTRLTTIRTVFWVVSESPSATASYRTLLGDSSTFHFLGGSGAPGRIWDSAWAHSNVWTGQTLLNGQPIDGTTTNRPRNLSLISLVTAGPVTADNFATDRQVAGRFWWGDLAELIIYDRPLSPEERRAVQDYLLAKYRLGPAVQQPVASPHGGTFTGSVSVTLRTATPGAELRFTTDGSEPTETSALYAGGITLEQTTTLKAKAFLAGVGESETSTAGFTSNSDTHPGSFGGLRLWWRADAGLPSGAGDLWLDQSGLQNHGVQGFSGGTPVPVGDVANGLPVMRFDGNDRVNFTTRLTAIRTAFWVVLESTAATPEYRSLLGDSLAYHFLGGSGAPGRIWDPAWADPNVWNGPTTFLNGQPINGTQTNRPRTLSLISLVTTGPVAAHNFAQDRQVPGRFWWGDLAELIVYDRALTDTERKAVESYLNGRYDLFVPPTSLAVDDPSVVEGNAGASNLVFTVSLTPSSSQTVTVGYATANGSASAPGDYAATSGTLSFAPGETAKTVTVPVTGDLDVEAAETVFLGLSGAVNSAIVDGQGQGTILDDDPARVSGTIRNGDGATPLPDATVTLSSVGTTTTDAAGQYSFEGVPGGTYTLTAQHSGKSAPRSVLVNALDVTADQTVPLPVLRGVVREGDGALVSDAVVSACGLGDCTTTASGADGSYIFYGLPAWPSSSFIAVTADPGDGSGVIASNGFTYSSSFVGTLVRDLVFPAAGALSGTVRDAGGSAVASASVQVSSSGGTLLRTIVAGPDGSFSAPRLPPGDVRVYARDGDEIPGEAAATVIAGQTVGVDVTLVPKGTLQVTSTAQIRSLRIEAPEAPRIGVDPWTLYACFGNCGEGGQLVLVQSFTVPAGLVRVVDDGSQPTAGETVLGSGETGTVLVSPGSHILRQNGPSGPFVGSRVEDVEDFHDVVKPELDGQAMRSLLAVGDGLRVRRQEFAPESGAFTRTLTLVSNPGSEPVTVAVGSGLMLGDPEWALQGTSSGDAVFDLGDSYAVAVRSTVPEVNGDPLGGDPEGTGRAIVFGSLLAPTAVSFSPGSVEVDSDGVAHVTPASLGVSHSLTIPPGGTRALLAFAVHGAVAGEALARAQALADLSDPDALMGLSAADRQGVVNFTMPPMGQVAGVVKTASNETVANAPVGAFKGPALVAETATDAFGNYSLTLDVGDYALVAFDPSTNRPGRRLVSVVANEVRPADIVLLSDAAVGTVRVTGAVPDGDVIRVEADGYWPFWRAVATFQGEATIAGVPAGPVTARSESDASLQAQGEVPPGGLLELSLEPQGTATISGSVFLAGVPVPNAQVLAIEDSTGLELLRITADESGQFVLTGLPAGWIRVQALDPVTRLTGESYVLLDAGGSSTTAVSLTGSFQTGTVLVRGVDAAGAPAVGTVVTLGSLARPIWSEQAPLDANGQAVFATVPNGDVRGFVAGTPASSGELAYLPSGQTLSLTLRIGEQRRDFPVELTAPGDMPYFAFPDSAVEANTAGQWTCVPFCTGFSSFEPLNYPWQAKSAGYRESPQGREAVTRAWSTIGLQAERRIFVPVSGGFVRVLDVLENTGDADITVPYYVEHLAQTYAGAAWSIGTTSTSAATVFDLADDYVTLTSTDAASPELAWVIAGPGGGLERTTATGDLYYDGSSYSSAYFALDGPVTVPAGQKVILMRFTVQKPHGQTTEVQALADKLWRLDASVRDAALAMIAPEEWPFVINFAIQP